MGDEWVDIEPLTCAGQQHMADNRASSVPDADHVENERIRKPVSFASFCKVS